MSLSPTGTADPGEAGRLFREGNLAGALDGSQRRGARRRRPISAPGSCWPSCWPSPATSTAPMSSSMPAPTSTRRPAIVVAEFRQLLRGETARRQLFSDGRVPEFLGEPTAAQRSSLAAIVALRNGDPSEAAELAAEAEEARPHPAGTRAATRPSTTCATPTTCWPPASRSSPRPASISGSRRSGCCSWSFINAKRPRDLFWRRATMQVADGPDGEVYLPALYPPMTSSGHGNDRRVASGPRHRLAARLAMADRPRASAP